MLTSRLWRETTVTCRARMSGGLMTGPQRLTPSPVWLSVLTTVCVLSLTANAIVGSRALYGRFSQGQRPPSIPVGAVAPALSVVDSQGSPSQLTFKGEQPTILYVFSPSCVWCARNLPGIKQIASSVSNRYRVVGVSLVETGFNQFVAGKTLPFPLYALEGPQGAALRTLGFQGSPFTVAIGQDGRVIAGWVGAYGQHTKASVESFFGIVLPPLAVVQAAPPMTTQPD